VHISVIGTGYVGLVTGACFSEFGVNVTCMDTDTKRIARLEKGDVPFYEPGITELVAKGIRENRISFTTDIAKAVDKALVIFIAVGTPPRPDGSAGASSWPGRSNCRFAPPTRESAKRTGGATP